jgi:8-oxo-dGTP pyrophosphatase MutT (NUDIX family)
MRITEIIHTNIGDDGLPEDESDHWAAHRETGFYGRAGAGCIFLARVTGHIGIAHRAFGVEEPNTWGTVGGALDSGDDPQRATIREARQEVGYIMQPSDYLVPIDLFQSGTFRYTTFLYVVTGEFTARLNWENQAFQWFEFGHWPQPLHFGLAATLSKPQCQTLIKAEIEKYRQS